MRFIPSFLHGFLDYVFGLFVAASPWLLGFADGTIGMYIPIVMGLGAMVYSLLTRYELGVIKIIPFHVHLIIDAISGVLLLASPYIFHLPERSGNPLFWFGLFEIGAVLFTNPKVVGVRNAVEVR